MFNFLKREKQELIEEPQKVKISKIKCIDGTVYKLPCSVYIDTYDKEFDSLHFCSRVLLELAKQLNWEIAEEGD